MGEFRRESLPDPRSYFEGEGLKLTGRGPWVTSACNFHGSKSTMRINLASGAFVCMAACGARGGDVLAYQMAAHGQDFIAAARTLGAWVESNKPDSVPARPTGISPRAALQLLNAEANLAAVAASNVATGMKLRNADRKRLLTASARIATIAGLFA